MAVQEDLATLFARNMSLAHPPPPPPPPPPAAEPEQNKIVYISQHYTHSAHVAPPAVVDEPMQRSQSEPATSADLELYLRYSGVDTSTLSFSQVDLFRRADDAQRARLVQLWTICPQQTAAPIHTMTWNSTSLEQEEMLARQRYEQAQGAVPVAEVEMSLDGTAVDPGLSNSPSSVQSSDSRWQPMAHTQGYMEPYMQSGYEELARKEYDASARKASLDPVYNKTAGGTLDWERQQWMENQYGSFVGGWRDDEDML
ncbi:hypothetical protein BD289DRAFT_482424 [Coniella lustricola]|uniref:Uncharacterized protein n=1 Tax=Coniella lustricola TaxID=2025994 RepID=A0A2T3A8Z6_9PEZI|nr:hypothetical protein BD289DRAFT_482424 [Coniella lustricola]